FPSVMTTLCTGCFSLLAIIIGLLMIIDFIIEDLMLNSYLQKNFHTLVVISCLHASMPKAQLRQVLPHPVAPVIACFLLDSFFWINSAAALFLRIYFHHKTV
uniref:hypothetical protein n=2 Tax=Enterocloster clostridioformis TaxID=1531 RepID=UPI003A8D3B59